MCVSSILLKVCSFLRNRFQEIRDVARNTLTKIMEVLGVQYLMYILKEMQSTLVHGYQVMLKFFVALSRFVDFFVVVFWFFYVLQRETKGKLLLKLFCTGRIAWYYTTKYYS